MARSGLIPFSALALAMILAAAYGGGAAQPTPSRARS